MKPDLIIFDCDGVLIDSEGFANQSLVETLADFGIQVSLEEALARYTGFSTPSVFADIETRYRLKLPEDFLLKRRRRWAQLCKEGLTATRGVQALVDALPFKKCVASHTTLQYKRLILLESSRHSRDLSRRSFSVGGKRESIAARLRGKSLLYFSLKHR